MSSSSASTGGSRPTIHSTAAIHASQEMVRSSNRTRLDAGNTARSTRAKSRMTASDTNTDTAMRSTSTVWKSSTTRRATSVSTSASSGNSTPSKVRSPNQIES
jgi:hypothetical protein